MSKVVITNHFQERLSERFGSLELNQAITVNPRWTSVWTTKNIDKCSNMEIRYKILSRGDSTFMIENFKLGLILCGEITQMGRLILKTIISRR